VLGTDGGVVLNPARRLPPGVVAPASVPAVVPVRLFLDVDARFGARGISETKIVIVDLTYRDNNYA
jgi:hypothetical protein